MHNSTMGNPGRMMNGICWALLLLGVVIGITPAHSEGSDRTSQSSWFSLGIDGLDDDTAVFAVRRNGELMLVGTREQGVFMRDQNGAAWTQPTALQDSYARDLWLSGDGAVALAATLGHGLWHSTDGGETWSRINQLDTPYHYSIDAWQGGVQNMLFVGTANNGVWKSSDLGESWSPTGLLESPGAVAVAVVDAQVVYAGSVNNGLFKTGDGGDTWDPIAFQGQTVRAIALDPDEPSRLLASVLSDGVFRPHYSVDGGVRWTQLDDGLDDASILALSIARVADERFVLAGAVDRGVFRLDESGENNPTWRPYGLAGHSIYDLGNFGGALYAGADGGVWLLWPEAYPRWLPVILHSRTATRAQ